MSIYLTPSSLPELASLSAKQRRLVWRMCVHPRLLRGAVRLLALAVFIASGLLGWWLGEVFGLGIWGNALGTGCVVGLGSYLHDMLWASRWRPHIARFIQDHAAEVQSAA